MADALSPAARRYLIRAGLWFVFGGVLCTVVVLLVPNQVPPDTASNFFLAASGVNATLLVAIAITISSIVRRGAEASRSPRMILFVAQLSVVFIGMIASGFGILLFNAATPFDSLTFVALARLIFVTWVIGFQLLVVGIQVSTLPEPSAPSAEGPPR
ncbi:MAG TPA: hypothetical protein VEY12_03085 [Thermoplasmata archaeon]|nr:hypothetical protein [Thermoplasmata archaeon]